MKSENSLVPSLLLVLFIGLKLCGVIDWSWWWVMSPFWVPLALAAIVMCVYGALLLMESPEHRAARKLREFSKRLSR